MPPPLEVWLGWDSTPVSKMKQVSAWPTGMGEGGLLAQVGPIRMNRRTKSRRFQEETVSSFTFNMDWGRVTLDLWGPQDSTWEWSKYRQRQTWVPGIDYPDDFTWAPESCLKPNFLWIFQLCGLIPLSLKPVKAPFLFTTKRILGYPHILSQYLKFHIAYLLVLIEEIKLKIANMLSTISPKVLCSLITVIFIYLVIQFDIKHSKDRTQNHTEQKQKSPPWSFLAYTTPLMWCPSEFYEEQ